MKKLFTIFALCVVCVCCAVGFSACDFGVPNNSGKEITNEQPEDKDKEENNNQNNSEENNNEEEIVVITKDTDFDALISDKVEKDVFISALLLMNSNLYYLENVNYTMDIFNDYAMATDCGTIKFDGLKRYAYEKSFVKLDNNEYSGEAYIILAEDLKSYKQFDTTYKGDELEKTQVRDGLTDAYNEIMDLNKTKQSAEALWESAEYNETTKQYEISQVDLDGRKLSGRIKIKDGYVVFSEFTDAEGLGSSFKCYDFGTTVVDIPDDIMAAMNAAK